jgi:hypothetical protein
VRRAVGFRGHVAVTVGPDLEVVDRREIRVRDGQPYHLARSKPVAQARKVIERAQAEANARMLEAITGLRRDLDVTAVGLVLGSFHLPSKLEDLLASHPACHAAEGEMAREAVFAACEALHLPVTAVRDREIEITERVDRIGKLIGPPWRKDHKLAAVVAWRALSASVVRRRDRG